MLLTAAATVAHAEPLSDAFSQGSALGRSGNSTARGAIRTPAAPSLVPHYTTNPAEASYFSGPGLGAPAAARLDACAATSSAGNRTPDPACEAVTFSQTNPAQRPNFSIAPNDPLLARSRAIRTDPHAIAGNLAGTYSACTVQTVAQPAIFESALCHQARTTETLTCDRTLLIQVTEQHTCFPGTWFGNFWVNTWGNGEVGRRYAGIVVNAYCQPGGTQRLSLHAICTESPCAGAAQIDVDAASGAPSPQTFTHFIGRSWYQTDLFNRVDYRGGSCSDTECRFDFCTRYEAEETSCWESECRTTQVNYTLACGTFVFPRPRSIVTVTDTWDGQCTALEARTR
jgi:hypothetical protein